MIVCSFMTLCLRIKAFLIDYFIIFLHSCMYAVKFYPLLSFKRNCKDFFMGEKKVFSTRIDEDLIKRLKHRAVDEGASLTTLLEEAIQDLLKKYEKKDTARGK